MSLRKFIFLLLLAFLLLALQGCAELNQSTRDNGNNKRFALFYDPSSDVTVVIDPIQEGERRGFIDEDWNEPIGIDLTSVALSAANYCEVFYTVKAVRLMICARSLELYSSPTKASETSGFRRVVRAMKGWPKHDVACDSALGLYCREVTRTVTPDLVMRALQIVDY